VEFPAVEAATSFRTTAADLDETGDMWRESWFPVLSMWADEVIVVDCATAAGEVWLVRWEADEIRPAAPDLATFFDRAAVREAGVEAGRRRLLPGDPGAGRRRGLLLSRGSRRTTMASVIELPPDRFDELVSEALDTVPPELAALMDNVAVFVEDEPPADDPELLGWYEGTPLTERDWSYGGVLPDRIVIYRGPTLRMCADEDEVVDEVHITVVHEIAHHFGIDDNRLHELGYD
jgi:predicted Zn-dependent protease with MMP-like domain